MWTQFKQTISEEFQQNANVKKLQSDAINTIERNARLLNSEPTNVDDVIASLEDMAEAVPNSTETADLANGREKTPGSREKTPESEDRSKQQVAETAPDPPTKSNESATPSSIAPSIREPELESRTQKEEEKQESENGDVSKGEKSKEPDAPNEERGTPQKDDTKKDDPKKDDPKKDDLEKDKKADVKDTKKVDVADKAEEVKPAATASATASGKVTPTKTASNAEDEGAVAAKLAKFARYESMYPKLLKAYKEEKKRGDLVKLYEKVLSEHTPATSIAEPQILVDYLTDLKKKTTLQHEELGRVTAETTSWRRQAEEAQAELAAARRDAAQKQSALNTATAAASAKAAEAEQVRAEMARSAEQARQDSELTSKIGLLEAKLEIAEQARDAAAKSLATVRSQLDEVNVRMRENYAETEALREELRDSEKTTQARSEELNAAKAAIRTREKSARSSTEKTDSHLSNLTAEKELLESEVEMLNKRILRESEQMQVHLRAVRARLQDAEATEEELRSQIAHLHDERASRQAGGAKAPSSAGSASEATTSSTVVVDSGVDQQALSDAQEAATNAVKANELLQQVHKDNSLRIEKLQRTQRSLESTLDRLQAENRQLKASKEAPTSPSRAAAEPSDAGKQQAYLRNVLLGFIEHKDQRKALLPVLATLLQMQDSDSSKFMNAFA